MLVPTRHTTPSTALVRDQVDGKSTGRKSLSWNKVSAIFGDNSKVDEKTAQKSLLDAIGSELEPRLREQLSSIVHRVYYPAKTILFREGDEASACYLILTGRVGIFQKAPRHADIESEQEDNDSNDEDDNEDGERQLHIVVESALDLKCGDEGNIDPFCIVKLGAQSCESPVIQDAGPNPVWNFEATLPLKKGAKEITFEVWEYDKFSRNDLLGFGSVPVKKVRRNKGFNGQIDLVVDDEAMPGSGGYLRVIVNWNHPNDMADGVSEAQSPRNISQKNATLVSFDQAVKGLRKADDEAEREWDILGFQITSLGPGKLVGELAMMTDSRRSAGVRCETDCEFAKVNKSDFERLLKEDLKRIQVEKRTFFYGCVPGLNALPVRNVDEFLYWFRKCTVPRGHCFFKQGTITHEPSVFFIVDGNVELSFQDPSVSHHKPIGSFTQAALPTCGLPKLQQKGVKIKVGLLGSGQVFGTLKGGEPETLSAVATAASVEVFYIRLPHLRKFPNKILSEIHAKVRLTSAWHSKRCVEGIKTTFSHNETSARTNAEAQNLASKSKGLMSSPFLRSKSTFMHTAFADCLERSFPMYKPLAFEDRTPVQLTTQALRRSQSQSSEQSIHLSRVDACGMSEGAAALRNIAQKYSAGPEQLFRPALTGLHLGVPATKGSAPPGRSSIHRASVRVKQT